jgi:hypothetical protein
MVEVFERAKSSLAQPLARVDTDEDLFGPKEDITVLQSFGNALAIGNLTATAVRAGEALLEDHPPEPGFKPGSYLMENDHLDWLLRLADEDADVADALGAMQSSSELESLPSTTPSRGAWGSWSGASRTSPR